MVLLKTPEILVLRTVIKIWFFSGEVKRLVFLCSVQLFFSLFFPYLFLFRVLLIWFVFLQLLAIEKRLADFSDRQQILLKTPTMQLNKVYHGKLNRQNRNKMGEDRQRKLAIFFSCLFLFHVLLIWFVFLQLLAIEKRLAIFSDRQ